MQILNIKVEADNECDFIEKEYVEVLMTTAEYEEWIKFKNGETDVSMY